MSTNEYIMNAEDAVETMRLVEQDRIFRTAMGGVLVEQEANVSRFRSILDLACGPGTWCLDMADMLSQDAHSVPAHIIGVDKSERSISYARSQAEVRQLTNVTFHVGDILDQSPFPPAAFDLVNARMMHGFLSTNTWPMLLNKSFAALRPGGILRLTEDEFPLSTSPALEMLGKIVLQAFKTAGKSFSPSGWHTGITCVLPRLLEEVGCQNIHYRPHALNFSARTPCHDSVCSDLLIAFQLGQPFMVSSGAGTKKEIEDLYQHMTQEIQSPDFCGMWYMLTAWGEKPA